MSTCEPSDEWLKEMYKSLSVAGVAPGDRCRKALEQWFFGKPADPFGHIGTPAFSRIHEWFDLNTKQGDVSSAALRSSVFFFDQAFWAVDVPLSIGGRGYFDHLHCLNMRATETLELLRNDAAAVENYAQHLEQEIDLFVTIEHLEKEAEVRSSRSFGMSLLGSADLHLQAASSLLRLPVPNLRSIELLRFSVEIAMKAFLCASGQYADQKWDDISHRRAQGLTDGHDLKGLFDAVISKGGGSSLSKSDLALFPGVTARYSISALPLSDIWRAYQLGLCYVSMAAEKIESSL